MRGTGTAAAVPAVALAGVGIPPTAFAQEPATLFDERSIRLEPGDTISVKGAARPFGVVPRVACPRRKREED
jgi:hypothetical protein